ncbi:DUF881 domain-containing protein [Alicyclobacillus dauci]|uniref:DUF881 domain-containing protein n=1 Tax=Alicyclobacillus dauci TaxID=1475485 RepID=A0ABY6YYL2_9BACL|nr:DUF881 domain-containing protein [Alicyclobacillus dauci]WAH35529.1 DUF881 domain-containing protein [Alicyclobacillus dauci]
MQQRSLVWGITAITAAFGFMLTVQITSRPSYDSKPTSYIDLRTQVQEAAQEHQLLEDDISKANAQLDEYHAASGSSASLQQALEHDKSTVEQQAGISPVSGPGLTIMIQDDYQHHNDFPDQLGTFPSMADQWLSQVVNVLFGNGATAISINGQRLVTTSSIRLVTGIDGIGGVHINGHPITMPYVITAVGDIQNMKAAMTVQNLALYFNEMGEDFLVTPYPNATGVQVSGYNGPLPGQWAKEVSGS